MRVLFATAELAPLVRVGGLAEAAGGLVGALRRDGIELEVVMPDFGGIDQWNPFVRRASIERGTAMEVGAV